MSHTLLILNGPRLPGDPFCEHQGVSPLRRRAYFACTSPMESDTNPLFSQPANVLHITTLDAGWRDKDAVLLHACFQLLTDFLVEEALLPTNWDQSAEYRHAKAKIDALAAWWTQRAAAEEAGAVDAIWSPGQYETDNQMLVRLIQVRQYLWT